LAKFWEDVLAVNIQKRETDMEKDTRMSKQKRKRSTSLSPTVDSIGLNPNDDAVKKAKALDKMNAIATAAESHAAFEAKAHAFASSLRTILTEAKVVQTRLVAVTITAREFIEANRDFLGEVCSFFAKNRGRKVKQTLNGHTVLKDWTQDLIGVTDDYMRSVFRKSDNVALPFEDGTTLLNAASEGKGKGDEKKDEKPDEKPAVRVPQVKFGNQLGMKTVAIVSNSTYSRVEKLAIVKQVLRQLLSFAEELKLDAADDSPQEVPPAGFKVEVEPETVPA
jgi:hypothetical protein